MSTIALRSHLRIALIAFSGGAIASFLVGIMTSGLAAAYSLVGMWVWGIVAKLGGEALANQRWLVVSIIAVVHGLAFAVMVTAGRMAFPRLCEAEWGGNMLLVALIAYGLLLAFAFPATP